MQTTEVPGEVGSSAEVTSAGHDILACLPSVACDDRISGVFSGRRPIEAPPVPLSPSANAIFTYTYGRYQPMYCARALKVSDVFVSLSTGFGDDAMTPLCSPPRNDQLCMIGFGVPCWGNAWWRQRQEGKVDPGMTAWASPEPHFIRRPRGEPHTFHSRLTII
jgi:hypothetical protein